MGIDYLVLELAGQEVKEGFLISKEEMRIMLENRI